MKQNEETMTLILEDDFIADGSVTSKIEDALKKLPVDWDILYVGHCDQKKKCNTFLDHDENICLTRREVFCATGYLLRNREVAKILFEKGNNKKPLVADRYFHKSGLNIYLIFPHLFKQRKNIDADINSPGGYFTFLANDTFEKSISTIGKKTRKRKIFKN